MVLWTATCHWDVGGLKGEYEEYTPVELRRVEGAGMGERKKELVTLRFVKGRQLSLLAKQINKLDLTSKVFSHHNTQPQTS